MSVVGQLAPDVALERRGRQHDRKHAAFTLRLLGGLARGNLFFLIRASRCDLFCFKSHTCNFLALRLVAREPHVLGFYREDILSIAAWYS